jgi:hypothetical protein
MVVAADDVLRLGRIGGQVSVDHLGSKECFDSLGFPT